MGYKTVPHEGKTIAQRNAERVAAKSDKATDLDLASERQFGITPDHALASIRRYEAAASDEPASDLWESTSDRVWGKAVQLTSTLSDDDEAYQLCHDALMAAGSPKEFWKKLGDSLAEDEEKE